jgi:hypothetical protein
MTERDQAVSPEVEPASSGQTACPGVQLCFALDVSLPRRTT